MSRDVDERGGDCIVDSAEGGFPVVAIVERLGAPTGGTGGEQERGSRMVLGAEERRRGGRPGFGQCSARSCRDEIEAGRAEADDGDHAGPAY